MYSEYSVLQVQQNLSGYRDNFIAGENERPMHLCLISTEQRKTGFEKSVSRVQISQIDNKGITEVYREYS